MPSSISSFKDALRGGRFWLWTWILAAVLAVTVLAVVEAYWRGHGYVPVILDSRQLWSLQRSRVDSDSHGKVIALLGASRTVYGINPKRLHQRLPGYKPVMLAINGRYPVAVLRDLAHDPDFDGVVLCDIDAMGLMHAAWDQQQSYVDYYHQQWSPSWRIHRIALTSWQRHAVISNPDMGWRASLRYLLEGGKPFLTFATYYANRSGDVDFSKGNPQALKRHFASIVDKRLAAFPDTSPETWLADLAPVADWVRAIQARGGTVIFYQSPTHGLERSSMDKVLPQDKFWDRLPEVIPAHFMDAMTVPGLARIPLPDNSHFDYRNKAAYTDALVHELLRRGWLKRLKCANRPCSTTHQAKPAQP